MNFDEILELLKVTEEGLNTILGAMGWEDKTEFTDTESEALLATHGGHTDHDWPYLESYLRYIANQAELTPEEYDELVQAIGYAGGLLAEYRDTFKSICEKKKSGMSVEAAVMPNSAIAETVAPFVEVSPSADLDWAALGIDLSAYPPEVLAGIEQKAELAAIETVSTMQNGLADTAAEGQVQLIKYFKYLHIQKVSEKMSNPEMEANFLIRMRTTAEELSGKKNLGITGATNPPQLQSSNS